MKPNPCPDPDRFSILDDQETSETERTELEAHLAGCALCRNAFRKMRETRQGMKWRQEGGGLSEDSLRRIEDTARREQQADPHLPDRMISRLNRRKQVISSEAKDLPLVPGKRWFWGTAAAILLAAGIAGIWMSENSGFGDSSNPSLNAPLTDSPPFSSLEIREPWRGIRLGTAPDTRYSLLEKENRPVVSLQEGVLAVDVAPGQSGFQVRTPFGTVEVIGTRFQVLAGKSAVSVRVYDGRVRLSSQTGIVTVDGGSAGFFFENRPPQVQQIVPLTPSFLKERLAVIETLDRAGKKEEVRVRWTLLSAQLRESREEFIRFLQDPRESETLRQLAFRLGRTVLIQKETEILASNPLFREIVQEWRTQ